MRKAFIILTGILFTLLFATCKQFTADIDDYLSRWSSEAYITDSSIKAVLQNDLNSIPSVPSAEDVSVTFKLKNPKSFSLDLPPAADPAKKVVVFEHLTQAPKAGTDYTLTQSEDRQSLTLTYKASFLKAHEWGAQDLSSTLSLYAADGRPFKQTYTLKLKANTPPPTPGFTVVKTKASPVYYVLCIKVPDMDKTVQGGLLHKDLARIEVNGASYTFSVNEAQTAFTKPEANVFITHSDVEKLDEPDAAAVPADSSWVLYYKTDVEVKAGAAKKDYTIKLIDEKGLVSGIVNASTSPNKPETEDVCITKGAKIPESGSGSDTDPAIIGTDSTGAELSVSSATANTTVHCTVSEIGGSTPVKYDGNPVTVPLPLDDVSEKQYKLEYYTDGEGFAATPVKTVYYKVVKRHTVTFNVVGGNGSLEGKYGSDQQTATTSPVTLTVPHGYSVTFTATPTDSTHYKVGDWTCPSEGFMGTSGNPTASLTVTADTTVSVQFVQLNALTLSMLKIHGKDASAGSVTLPYTITQVGKDDISLAFSGQTGIDFTVTPSLPLNLTEGIPQSITIKVAASPGNYPEWTKTVSITRAKNDKAKLQSFTLNGETKTADANGDFASEYEVASETATVAGFSFADGSTGATASVSPEGNVPIPEDTGKTFTITVKAQDGTQSTVEFTVKRKKYKVDYSVETVDGEPGGTIEAGTSGQTTGGTVWVTHGGSVTFKGRPAAGDWKVAGWTGATTTPPYTTEATLSNVKEPKTVTVKFYQSTLKNPATWKDLARAVKSAPDNATLTIDGEIKATDAVGDKGIINIEEGKRLTIKGKGSSAVLNADGKSSIFDVSDILTLENITLKNGAAFSNQSGGAGVYINSKGTLIMKGSSAITDCSAVNWGGGVYVNGGTFEMHDASTITGCLANGLSNMPSDDPAKKGGGVYVSSGTFKMQDSAIVTPSTSGDTDKPGKNDVYLKDGKTITVGSTLLNAHAARITPELYKKQTVLKADSGVTLKYEVGKFTVTPDGSDTWKIDSEGKLTLYEATIKGSPSSNDAWKKLKQAVANASDGSTITIDGEIKATNHGSGDDANYGRITIDKDLTIKGKGGAGILDANQLSPIFIVERNKTFTLDHMTLKNGKKDGAPQYTGATGCGVYTYGTFNMQDSTITKCEAVGDGGGVFVTAEGIFTMKNSTITGCTATENGGGVCVNGGTFKMQGLSAITGCEAIGNTVNHKYGEGGGVYNKGTFEMTGGEIKNNKARVGGGIQNDHKLILTGATLTGNTASFIGGALSVSDSSLVEMTGGEIKGNTCSNGGGGVYIHRGSFTLKSGASIEGNTALYGGGAVVNQYGTLIINGGSIKSNTAQQQGGGVYVSGNSTKRATLRMIQGDISDNGAGWNGTSYTGEGGGVYNEGIFEMTGGEIKGNKAATGGGVYFSEGTFEMKDSAVVTPATGSEANSKGKNDVYLVTGKITVDGSLSHAHVARITPREYTAGHSYLTGNTNAHHLKFAVTSKVIDDGIAEVWEIKSNGDLEKSKYIDVRYNKLAYYLSSTYASSYAVDGINYIKITGTIPKDDLKSKYFERMGKLARTIQDAQKKVALELPDSIPELTTMYQCFYKCEYLVSLEKIPSRVTSMHECFQGCTALTKAPVIPPNVDDMEHCFHDCTALTEAPDIPSRVTKIKYCFQGCKELIKAPVLPSGVKDIYGCFAGCEKLTKAPAIPSGVTDISQCFQGCKALTRGPDIPSTVYNMYRCFQGCTSLKELKLMCNYGDDVTYFTDVFDGCTALKTGGIQVPQNQLEEYKHHAGKMKTTDDKFSGF